MQILLLSLILVSFTLAGAKNSYAPTENKRCPTTPPKQIKFNFEKCENNAFMCCYTKKMNKNGIVTGSPGDNTNVCDTKKEGSVHCHGFAWSKQDLNSSNNQLDDDLNNLLHFVNQTDHFCKRGYFGGVDGFPDCGCIEDMPKVSRADCTQINPNKDGKKEFIACTGKTKNNLRSMIRKIDKNNEILKGKINLFGSDCKNKK
jgi:hypothetical protein